MAAFATMAVWFLFFIGLLLAALALLNVFPAPAWLDWRLGVLTGEYGHWLALVPLAFAALAWPLRAHSVAATFGTLITTGLALGLLLRPAIEAALLARTLPGELARAFGRADIRAAPFSFRQLMGRRPPLAPFRTFTFAPGLELDFHAPADGAEKPAPCVIVIHGGGWNGGDRTQVPQLNHWLAQRGFAVAAISYRLAPAFLWPAPRDDTLLAIAFLKAHASEMGIDPERLVLLGRSAGGQIAEAVGYGANDPAIRGVVGLYAPSDLNFGYAHAREDDAIGSPQLMRQFLGGTPATARANYDSASAMEHVNRHSPPTLLLHGQLDPLVWHRHSVRLSAQLAGLGVPCAFVSLPWATHGFEYNLNGPGGQLTTFALEWFLRARLK